MTSEFDFAGREVDFAGRRTSLSRRSLLRYSALAGVALGGAGLLAACGSAADDSSNGSTADGSKFGTVAVQLSWLKNIEFAGEYFADSKGYFKEAGFGSVNLIAGGAASTSVEAGLDTGKIWLGLSAPQTTAKAVLEGLPGKIIGTTYQKNPFAIVSSAAKPIKNPEDMRGRKIGVQDTNQLIFKALLTANGLKPSDVVIVPAQYDPTPLANGEVDGWVSYVTNEPITLTAKGFANTHFLFADYNLPLVAETLTVKQSTIDKEREKLKAFLVAEIKGWKDAVADPAESARLAVEVYGKDQKLDLAEQTKEAVAQNDLVTSADATANGLLTMTDKLIEQNITALRAADLDIKAEQLFDLSVLREVYAENPGLKA
ncbi:ABC-type nitrate/sulfonate/bicarbonate transport system substrate-binding protein [Nocardia tenerifensis]|uniref:Thiamine pyrimidine synthase n=2 Tax=Nocardia tenerifensis TaxID=228006 RepID=A0A318KET8_9NOCA|nr:ABC transporter substrate-binding protein [Nocardia tenerifensis]PXX65103.1 ABC-type nitrate/sulfonate/bicarbonate transport system substrate-binding protein [Nocardia tenerifensis]